VVVITAGEAGPVDGGDGARAVSAATATAGGAGWLAASVAVAVAFWPGVGVGDGRAVGVGVRVGDGGGGRGAGKLAGVAGLGITGVSRPGAVWPWATPQDPTWARCNNKSAATALKTKRQGCLVERVTTGGTF
jgi:hypothetical protein